MGNTGIKTKADNEARKRLANKNLVFAEAYLDGASDVMGKLGRLTWLMEDAKTEHQQQRLVKLMGRLVHKGHAKIAMVREGVEHAKEWNRRIQVKQ